MPRHGSSPEATSPRRTGRTSPILASPGPLYQSATALRGAKRSRSPANGSSPKARRRVHFSEGGAVIGTFAGFDGSEADRPGRTGDSRDGTSGADRPSGADCTYELSLDVFASLMRADDPLMQLLGSLLSAQQAKNDDVEKLLATFKKKARINQMVRDHKERGVSTFHHDCYHMAHVFESIILPHITDRSIHVYSENLDWGIAEPEELARAFSLIAKLPKSGKSKIFHRHSCDSDFGTLPPATVGWRHYLLQL